MKKIMICIFLFNSLSLFSKKEQPQNPNALTQKPTEEEVLREIERAEDEHIKGQAAGILMNMAHLLTNPHNPAHVATCVAGMATSMFNIFSTINRKRGHNNLYELTEQDIMHYLESPDGKELLTQLKELLSKHCHTVTIIKE